MALVPCQVLRVAILLSYFSILCAYNSIDIPAHQTYGGSWKFLTFIDLVRPIAAPTGCGSPLQANGGCRKSSQHIPQPAPLPAALACQRLPISVVLAPVGLIS
ncbi:androgen-induced gene 1 protein isoform X7 [Chelonoidis abingdonii]|uniref:androgen-induced gene 1 protein isoform X7 n=1 Tax=Chelonoidis abingdonii TaxID=106734 RepID=UPI003F49AF11